ncbi:PREDICTED: raftlin isoform X1 [Thamnophis sirtalis]|uniref:Raftlin isoform X1 n=1 Tax=Thamnophis sirtalis TaxID=35019 RepID=A0A6I9YSS8_9SAUR|nr:PREDICTED: raftlin isoform X1 [Thamnophis sirtalis]
MGCKLNKMEKHDDKRPGNIYSTLKRAQVETKTDTFYEYHYLDFTTLSNAELRRSAIIKLSSLRDLPLKLQDFYYQGFRLAAIYPFLQPSNKNEKIIQEQIFRAVLIKKMERPLRRESVSEWNSLEIESCFFSDQLPDKSKIPDLIKKIQDAASRGLKFVGIVPQHVFRMSSKSTSAVISISPSSLELKDDKTPLDIPEDCGSLNLEKSNCGDICKVPAEEEECSDQQMNLSEDLGGEQAGTEHINLISSGELARQLQETEILALFNQPATLSTSSQYYTVTIPVRTINDGKSIFQANWLEYMTDHFRKGSTLVHGIFNHGMINDTLQGMTDGVFIFEDLSVDDGSMQGYDAIVVEQWTILDGVHVQTDYIPLLNSLAVYGWQLTCVIPTSIVKTKRDGRLATKQIVFLQRPFLPQKNKRKQSKFHWRFSKQDQHQKQEKKSLKKKLSAGAQQQQREETQESEATNRRSSEAQFPTNDLQLPVISYQQLACAKDRTVEHKPMPSYNSEMSAETGNARQSDDEDITGFCLSQKGAHENCESQMFQEHYTTADDGMFEAEAAETDWIPDVSAD